MMSLCLRAHRRLLQTPWLPAASVATRYSTQRDGSPPSHGAQQHPSPSPEPGGKVRGHPRHFLRSYPFRDTPDYKYMDTSVLFAGFKGGVKIKTPTERQPEAERIEKVRGKPEQRSARGEWARVGREHALRVLHHLWACPDDVSKILEQCIPEQREHVGLRLESMKLCLNHAYLRQRERPDLDQGPVARPFLNAVSAEHAHWLPTLIETNKSFVDKMCCLAIAEGLEQTILDWCTAQTSERDLGHACTNPHRSAWRARLLASLVYAHVTRNSGNADQAIRCLMRVADANLKVMRKAGTAHARDVSQSRKPGLPFHSFWPAVLRLVISFVTGSAVSTDSRLFGRLQKFHQTFLHNAHPEINAWDRAVLALHHPEHPCETETVALLRDSWSKHRLAPGDNVAPLPEPLRQRRVIRGAKKARDVALSHNNVEDAQWLVDTFGQHFDTLNPPPPPPPHETDTPPWKQNLRATKDRLTRLSPAFTSESPEPFA